MTVLFTPSVTRADVAVVYPGASCEPTPETTARAPTAAEDNELRRLIGVVLADAGEVDRDEALAISLTVPHAALTSFRALAGEHMRNGLP
jgi:hypothetical protein